MHALYLSAAHKSSGKTLAGIGLCAALRERGKRVQPFKKGPDYIDPRWLALAAGRDCFNLDFHTMDEAELRGTFARGADADVIVVEGTKGLHDGVATNGRDSNAALARLLDVAAVLVIDCQGMTRGVAPLLLGLRDFDPGVRIAGVILNRVGGARHEQKLRAALAQYCDLPVFGALASGTDLGPGERHLGLLPANEDADARARVAAIGEWFAGQVDLDALLAASASTAPAPAPAAPSGPAPGRITLGVVRDRAFGFYYPDDLEALQRAGAELVFVDALRQQRLPALDALFIGGGFPETQLAALSANRELREAIRGAVDGGLPTYAECGGLMYLCRSLAWRGRRADMVGVIDADCVMGERPVGRGYVALGVTADAPWPVADDGRQVSAHEFHYSHLENLPAATRFAYSVRRGHGVDGRNDGIVQGNLLASYAHLRHTRQSPWTRGFVDFVRTRRPAEAACRS